MTRHQFTSQKIEEIEKEWMAHRNGVLAQPSYSNKKFTLEKLPGRNLRHCVVCSNRQNGIKRSNLICKKGLHDFCAGKHNC